MSSYRYPDTLPVTTTGGWARPGWWDILVGKWDRERILSAGLIDIKTHYSETPEDIIERVRTCLEYRDLERLEISTDCGLRRVPRYLAISKMSAAAEAARRLRASG
jgi:5-methyltetrahydropteroyltriglutamate--homocysteine methyltransferase